MKNSCPHYKCYFQFKFFLKKCYREISITILKKSHDLAISLYSSHNFSVQVIALYLPRPSLFILRFWTIPSIVECFTTSTSEKYSVRQFKVGLPMILLLFRSFVLHHLVILLLGIMGNIQNPAFKTSQVVDDTSQIWFSWAYHDQIESQWH